MTLSLADSYLESIVMHAHEAINDAIAEAVAINGSVNFTEALKFVPDEFHTKHLSLRDRFVHSVAAQTDASGYSAYSLASYALDI